MTRALLRAASWIVLRRDREPWLAEWRAELEHVERADRRRALAFALGAFPDALWLRRHDPQPREALLTSPLHCIAALAALAGLAFAVRPTPTIAEDVIAIREHSGPKTLGFEQYRTLADHLPAGFTAVAFYRPVHGGPAVATRSLRQVLSGSPLPRGISSFVEVDDPGPGRGYVLARLPSRPPAPYWHIRIPSPTGKPVLLDCSLVAPRLPFLPLAVILAAALIVVFATTSFDIGTSARRSPRAWIFFGAKLALSMTCVYFAAGQLPDPILAQGLIVMLILSIRWAIKDQRRRCPVCLRLVTNPVSFGCLSHTLLDWHGSEFVCPEGHGLLQVSATVASPYAAQQWLRL